MRQGEVRLRERYVRDGPKLSVAAEHGGAEPVVRPVEALRRGRGLILVLCRAGSGRRFFGSLGAQAGGDQEGRDRVPERPGQDRGKAEGIEEEPPFGLGLGGLDLLGGDVRGQRITRGDAAGVDQRPPPGEEAAGLDLQVDEAGRPAVEPGVGDGVGPRGGRDLGVEDGAQAGQHGVVSPSVRGVCLGANVPARGGVPPVWANPPAFSRVGSRTHDERRVRWTCSGTMSGSPRPFWWR